MSTSMKTKQVLALALSIALAIVLTACGGESNQSIEAADETTPPATTAKDVASKDEDAMNHAEYLSAALDSPVTIEAFVQAKQSWWEDTASVYLQDADGGYFVYRMACSKEDFDKLKIGQKIKVSGYKSEWDGEVQIVDATFELSKGSYIAPPTDVTNLLGTDELIKHQNKAVSFTNLTIAPSKDDSGKEVAYIYNFDGSGSEGDDLYFNVSKDKEIYCFSVESFLTDAESPVYSAVKNLKIGDTVDLEGFLYWHDGPCPHITSITVK